MPEEVLVEEVQKEVQEVQEEVLVEVLVEEVEEGAGGGIPIMDSTKLTLSISARSSSIVLCMQQQQTKKTKKCNHGFRFRA